MIARTPKKTSKSNEDALAAFVQRKAEIDAMLSRLRSLSDELFGVAPDEVTWGHVGSLEHYAGSASRTAPSRRASTPPSRRISPPRPDRVRPPGLGLVGERWCSPQMEISDDQHH
jgi:hypothetical protein